MTIAQNGDVEWQTLGNILTAKLLGEVKYINNYCEQRI